MSGILPAAPVGPSRKEPKILLIYGPPKIGKTTKVAELPNNLILDFESGTELITALKLRINSISGQTVTKPDGTVSSVSLDTFRQEMVKYATEELNKTGKVPKAPYKYITVDTIDKLEEFCEVTATQKYKASTMGKTFKEESVLMLPNGAGYYHLRNEVIYQIDQLSMLCEHLILVSHIKEKLLNKGGVDVSVQDISLTGKLGMIVCAKTDSIGKHNSRCKTSLIAGNSTVKWTISREALN